MQNSHKTTKTLTTNQYQTQALELINPHFHHTTKNTIPSRGKKKGKTKNSKVHRSKKSEKAKDKVSEFQCNINQRSY